MLFPRVYRALYFIMCRQFTYRNGQYRNNNKYVPASENDKVQELFKLKMENICLRLFQGVSLNIGKLCNITMNIT